LRFSIFLAREAEMLIVTNSMEVYDRIRKNRLSVRYIPDLGVINLMSFKRKFRALPVDSIILFSDSSPTAYWIQKNYKTLMVSEDYIFGRGSLFYQTLLSQFERYGLIWRVLQYIAGSRSVLYGKTIYFRPCRLYSILIFLMWRVVFGFKENLFSLPGRYATRICIYSESYRDIYISNGVPSDKIVVTGSLSLESAADAIANYCEGSTEYHPVDVLLFAQPFYKYSRLQKETWATDIRSFVKDCQKSKASYMVSLHPRDDIEFYKDYIPEELLVFGNGDTENNIRLVKSAKLIVAKSSTTIELPILLKKPVAYINYSSYADINMMKHFSKEMILYNQNRVCDILPYIDRNLESIILHQDNEVRSTCFAISGVKDKIINIARTMA